MHDQTEEQDTEPFNMRDFDENNEYGDAMADVFSAPAFESNNAGSSTPSALGGEFTLVPSATEDRQEDSTGPHFNDAAAQAQSDVKSASIGISPRNEIESKVDSNLLDQNSPLSELSPLPSHNTSIDMDQENDIDEADFKAKSKSRDESPLSPTSSRQPFSSPDLASKTSAFSSHVESIAGPSSGHSSLPPSLSAASTSTVISPTTKRAETDKKIRTVLEVNAELFSICMTFYSKGIMKGPENEQFSRRLRENLTWLATQADKQGDTSANDTPLPELNAPTLPVTSIELPSLDKVYELYAQFPIIFARDIMRRERKSMMAPSSTLTSSTPSLPRTTPPPLSASTQMPTHQNSASPPVNGVSMKRDRPDSEVGETSSSPSHKRRDTGEGKSTQNLMMPPPPPPSASSPTVMGDPSQRHHQHQQSLNSGFGGSSSQSGGMSSMGPGLFPPGQNAQINGLGDLSATGLFAPGPSATSTIPHANNASGLDAQSRQPHMRMQMGRLSQSQQQQAPQPQGMGISPQQQLQSQLQPHNLSAQAISAQGNMVPQNSRLQEISLGPSQPQASTSMHGGVGMHQQQQQQQPMPNQQHSPTATPANAALPMQMSGSSGSVPGQQVSMGYTPPVLDPDSLQQIRQHGGAALQAYQILQQPHHPLVKRLLTHIPTLGQYPVLDQIRQLLILQKKMADMMQHMQNQGMWPQQQQLHAQRLNAQYDISQQGNPGMQMGSQFSAMANTGNPMRPQIQQQPQPQQMQQISLGSQAPSQGNSDGMSFQAPGLARSNSGGLNSMSGSSANNAQNMHVGLPGSLSHLDPHQRRPLLAAQQFAHRGTMQQPGMPAGLMNSQMLNSQQQQRSADLQRFAIAQAQAQRQTSPLNPNVGPSSPAIGSSMGHGDLQPSYPPGMPSNALQSGVPGIARSSRSPSVSDMGTPRISGGPGAMQGMGVGMGTGQQQISNDDYQRQMNYLAAQKKMQQTPQNPQSQMQQLGPTAWPQQQQSATFGYGQQSQPGNASNWPSMASMGYQQQQQQQGYPHAGSPAGVGMRNATPDQGGGRQSSSTPAPGSMSMHQQSQSPVVPDSSAFDMGWS